MPNGAIFFAMVAAHTIVGTAKPGSGRVSLAVVFRHRRHTHLSPIPPPCPFPASLSSRPPSPSSPARSHRRLSPNQSCRAGGSGRGGDTELLYLPGGALAPHSHQQSARAHPAIRGRTPVVGAFPDGQSALNLAAARLRHIADTTWSTKRYLNIELLKDQQMRGAITA